MSNTARDVANLIIADCNRRGIEITHLKLQKLLFLTQGIGLIVGDKRPLFREDIVCWKFGPVIEPIYRIAKTHGRGSITTSLEGSKFNPQVPSRDKARLIVKSVIDAYGEFTAGELVALTHDPKYPEGEPWHNTMKAAGVGESSPVIPISLMRRSFSKLLISEEKENASE